MKKITITIGISAYNEEKNIKYLLDDLLAQEQNTIDIRQIIVVSDASTDDTDALVSKIDSKRITLIRKTERSGLAHSQNLIMGLAETDIVVLLNADITIKDVMCIENLVEPIIKNTADLTSCNLQPLVPKGFFEKVLYHAMDFKNNAYVMHRSGSNIYTCHGPVRAFSRKLYKKLTFKQSIGEDAFSYLFCIKNGMRYGFVSNATVHFRLPSTFSEHETQSVRAFTMIAGFKKLFGSNFVSREFSIPKSVITKAFINEFITHPLHMTVYSLITFYMKLRSLLIKRQLDTWAVSTSSKSLYSNKKTNELFLSMRKLIYFVCLSIHTMFRLRYPRIIVLSYHGVDDSGWTFSISKTILEKQIQYLLLYFNPITTDDLYGYLNGKKDITKPSFLITFDDGYKNITDAIDLFKKYSIKPAVFVLADGQNADRGEMETDKPLLSYNDIDLLRKNGWMIGCHSATHPDFFKISSQQQYTEITGAKKQLEKNLDNKILYFAYPKGRYTRKIKQALIRAGYKLGFTMDDNVISRKTSNLSIPRIGIENTHTLMEFKATITKPAIYFRSSLKFIHNFFISIWHNK